MGLAICKQLAVERGGRICVHSTLGAGTRVEVFLPTRL